MHRLLTGYNGCAINTVKILLTQTYLIVNENFRIKLVEMYKIKIKEKNIGLLCVATYLSTENLLKMLGVRIQYRKNK